MLELAPAAVLKLKAKERDVSKLTMAEIDAIAFASFGGVRIKGDKAAHVAALQKLIAEQPAVLNLGAGAAVAAPPALAAAVPAAAEADAAPAAAALPAPHNPTPAAEPTLALEVDSIVAEDVGSAAMVDEEAVQVDRGCMHFPEEGDEAVAEEE